MQRVKVRCPNPACGKRLTCKAEYAGRTFECPGCGMSISIPIKSATDTGAGGWAVRPSDARDKNSFSPVRGSNGSDNYDASPSAKVQQGGVVDAGSELVLSIAKLPRWGKWLLGLGAGALIVGGIGAKANYYDRLPGDPIWLYSRSQGELAAIFCVFAAAWSVVYVWGSSIAWPILYARRLRQWHPGKLALLWGVFVGGEILLWWLVTGPLRREVRVLLSVNEVLVSGVTIEPAIAWSALVLPLFIVSWVWFTGRERAQGGKSARQAATDANE